MESDAVVSRHVGKLVGTWRGRIRREAWDYLDHILTRLLKSYYEQKEFDRELFQKMYHDLEEFFYNDTIPLVETVPLHNFTGDVDNIDLGDGILIRKITTNEKEHFLDSAKWSSSLPYLHIIGLRYVIELRNNEKKVFDDDDRRNMERTDSTETIDRLITVLRLFKEGIFGVNAIRGKCDLDIPVLGIGTRSGLSFKYFHGKTYNLSQNEIPEFKNLWQLMYKADLSADKSLHLAIRRFNYAYERDRYEDKLMDYMIAFEALFFKRGEVGEFAHKLASRVSHLLKDNFDDRKDVFNGMKDFYKKRGDVVHGEDTTIDQTFVNNVEEYLRQSIKIFLNRLKTQNHQDIIEHLDLD
jgi:hypothetical protein